MAKKRLTPRTIRSLGQMEVETRKIFKEFMEDLARSLTTIMKSEAREGILDSETTQSIIYGQLRGELGLVAPKEKIHAIIDAIQDAIKAELKLTTYQLRLNVSDRGYDLHNLLLLPGAVQPDLGFRSKAFPEPYNLEWLNWLLFKGRNIIVKNYSVYDSRNANRAGDYKGMRKGGRWQVPEQYQGTASNNFITRAIEDRYKKKTEKRIKQEISRLIKFASAKARRKRK